VIVGTTFRANSPYMRNFGLETFSTPSGFDPVNFWGRGGPYEYRMDRAEFQRIITAARSVDAVLSADVRDYMIDNYHFTNEVVGNGELGMNIADLQLRLIRR
jgi:hypothetical protein